MSDKSLVLSYSSGDDEPVDELVDEPVVKRRRGEGRTWNVVATHQTVALGKQAMEKHNDPVVTRVKGRTNRGVSVAFYYTCVKKSCGCTKEWRIATSLFSSVVCEEESEGEHTCHELFQRNGGRGLTFTQLKILNDATELGILTPKLILEHFLKKAQELLIEGIFFADMNYLFPDDVLTIHRPFCRAVEGP